MIKKGLMGLGVLALGTVVVLGWQPVKGYLITGTDMVKTTIEESVPFEVEVKRLESMIDDLNNVVAEHTRTCMERQVDYELLQEELSERETLIKSQRSDLIKAQALLNTQDDTFVISNKMYSRDEVNQDTLKRLEKFESDQKLLDIRRQTTNTLGQALADAREQLEGMKQKRTEYSEMLQVLRANHMQLEARKQLAATVKGLNLPSIDNEFGEVSELFSRLNKRIKVENQMIDTLPQKKNFNIDYSNANDDSSPAVMERLEAALGQKKIAKKENKLASIDYTVEDGAVKKTVLAD